MNVMETKLKKYFFDNIERFTAHTFMGATNIRAMAYHYCQENNCDNQSMVERYFKELLLSKK